MLHLSRAAETHEDLFIQRYQALEAWSLRLCGNDRQQAEDLVQDAFVAFTLSRPDLAGIENLDGYLRGMLRKLQLSRVRRAAQGAQVTRSLLDEDSAELGLRAVGAATVEATQELACVCRYACLRKGSSKAGSILILRFFHGYFPSEIAQIARCTPHLVDDWLRIARREARLFREEPHRLRFLRSPQPSVPVNALDAVRAGDPAECLLALRSAIFQAHEGRCWTRREMAHAYTASPESNHGALDASRLAHVVSCRRCLERINALLGLTSLDDRSPHDMLGPSGGAGGPRRLGPKPASRNTSAGRDRLWRTAYEHRASELRIVVNGFVVGTHTVGRTLTRQSVAVTLDEPMGSVEVFGERGVRLAFLDVQPLPEGPVDQSVSVDLSEQRRLQVRVSFARPFPEVHVEYEDPHWSADDVGAEDLDIVPREPRRSSRLAWAGVAGVYGAYGRPRWRVALIGVGLALYVLFAPAGTTAWAAERIGHAVVTVARELMALPRRLWGQPPLESRSIAPVAGLPAPSVSRRPVNQWLLPAGTDAPASSALGAEKRVRVALDALARLDAVGALLGGQVDVELTPRAVIVRGLVEDEARRREMLRALGPLARDRMVQVEVVTVAERLRQQRAATPRVLYRPIEFAADGIPVAAELRAHLTRSPEWTNADASVVESEVRRIATVGLRRSRAALLHAVLLQSLADRYDASDLRALDERAYKTWLTLLATHAAAFADELSSVRELLMPAFLDGDANVTSGDADERADRSTLNQTAARIGDLAIEIDEAIRAGLSASAQRTGRPQVKDAMFWQTVRTAERLARTLGR
jgi:DNA-directed RNA polymerase specialized sigma24 family protein